MPQVSAGRRWSQLAERLSRLLGGVARPVVREPAEKTAELTGQTIGAVRHECGRAGSVGILDPEHRPAELEAVGGLPTLRTSQHDSILAQDSGRLYWPSG